MICPSRVEKGRLEFFDSGPAGAKLVLRDGELLLEGVDAGEHGVVMGLGGCPEGDDLRVECLQQLLALGDDLPEGVDLEVRLASTTL